MVGDESSQEMGPTTDGGDLRQAGDWEGQP